MVEPPQEHPNSVNANRLPITSTIAADGAALSSELNALRKTLFPPLSQKLLRSFSSGEAAKLIGVADGYLRQLSLAGRGPIPETGPNNRRLYTLSQINELRQLLEESPKSKRYVPHRSGEEHCQVLAVVNFKGGSGKTTTAAHLAQYLALRGYRVLAVDLDPQASLSAMFGVQPETDLAENETLYAALRYDEQRRPLQAIIRQTYFPGLDLVPGNLELMDYEHDTRKALAKRSSE